MLRAIERGDVRIEKDKSSEKKEEEEEERGRLTGTLRPLNVGTHQ